jgi:hypothetical protein
MTFGFKDEMLPHNEKTMPIVSREIPQSHLEHTANQLSWFLSPKATLAEHLALDVVFPKGGGEFLTLAKEEVVAHGAL